MQKDKKDISSILTVLKQLIDLDIKLTIALLFCVSLGYFVIDSLPGILDDFSDALFFILGLSLILNFLYKILHKNGNFTFLLKFLQKIRYRIYPGHKVCSKCNHLKLAKFNNKKSIYEWYCPEHNNTEPIKLSCPHCRQNESVKISRNVISKCSSCYSTFSTIDLIKLFESRYPCHIKNRFPLLKSFHPEKTFIENVAFLLLLGIVISALNYFLFSDTGRFLIASLTQANFIQNLI